MTSGAPEAALDAELQLIYDAVMESLRTSKTSTLDDVKLALMCDRVRPPRAPLMMLMRVWVLGGSAGPVARDQAMAPSICDVACTC